MLKVNNFLENSKYDNFFYEVIISYYYCPQKVRFIQHDLGMLYLRCKKENPKNPEEKLLEKIGIREEEKKSYECSTYPIISHDNIYYNIETGTLNFYKTKSDVTDGGPYMSYVNVSLEELKEATNINVYKVIKLYRAKSELDIALKFLFLIALLSIVFGFVTLNTIGGILIIAGSLSLILIIYLQNKLLKDFRKFL